MAPSRRKLISCCHHHAKVAPASLSMTMITNDINAVPMFSQAQTVSSDSSSVLTDSTAGIKSGKGKVGGDLETVASILDSREGTIHFFMNYNLDYLSRRSKPIPYFYTQDRGVSKEPRNSPCVHDIRVTYDIFCDIIYINCIHVLL